MRIATDIGGTFTDLVYFNYNNKNKELTNAFVYSVNAFGDKIAIGSKSYGYILLKEEGGMEKIFEKEYQLVEALKEID